MSMDLDREEFHSINPSVGAVEPGRRDNQYARLEDEQNNRHNERLLTDYLEWSKLLGNNASTMVARLEIISNREGAFRISKALLSRIINHQSSNNESGEPKRGRNKLIAIRRAMMDIMHIDLMKAKIRRSPSATPFDVEKVSNRAIEPLNGIKDDDYRAYVALMNELDELQRKADSGFDLVNLLGWMGQYVSRVMTPGSAYLEHNVKEVALQLACLTNTEDVPFRTRLGSGDSALLEEVCDLQIQRADRLVTACWSPEIACYSGCVKFRVSNNASVRSTAFGTLRDAALKSERTEYPWHNYINVLEHSLKAPAARINHISEIRGWATVLHTDIISTMKNPSSNCSKALRQAWTGLLGSEHRVNNVIGVWKKSGLSVPISMESMSC